MDHPSVIERESKTLRKTFSKSLDDFAQGQKIISQGKNGRTMWIGSKPAIISVSLIWPK